MILGKLIITTQDKKDIAFILYVENNDANYVNEVVNIKSMNDPEGIQMTNAAGNDLSLEEFIQQMYQLDTDIDAKESPQITFAWQDSGESIAKYDLKISLIYEEDQLIPYEEAAARVDRERKAADILAQK